MNFSAVLKPLLEPDNRAISSLHFFLATMYNCGKRNCGMTVSRSCLSITIDNSGKNKAFFGEAEKNLQTSRLF